MIRSKKRLKTSNLERSRILVSWSGPAEFVEIVAQISADTEAVGNDLHQLVL